MISGLNDLMTVEVVAPIIADPQWDVSQLA